MNKVVQRVALTGVASALALCGTAGSAQAGVAEYTYNCRDAATGKTYNWKNTPIEQCNGLYMVYHNGSKISQLNTKNKWLKRQLAADGKRVTVECALSGGLFLLSIPGTTTGIGWVTTVGSAVAMGLACSH